MSQQEGVNDSVRSDLPVANRKVEIRDIGRTDIPFVSKVGPDDLFPLPAPYDKIEDQPNQPQAHEESKPSELEANLEKGNLVDQLDDSANVNFSSDTLGLLNDAEQSMAKWTKKYNRA